MSEETAFLQHHARRVRLCWQNPPAVAPAETAPALILSMVVERDTLIWRAGGLTLAEVLARVPDPPLRDPDDGLEAVLVHLEITASREHVTDALSRRFATETSALRGRLMIKTADRDVAAVLMRYAPDVVWGLDADPLWRAPSWARSRDHERLLAGIGRAAQGAAAVYLPTQCTIEGLERGLNFTSQLRARGFAVVCGPHLIDHSDCAPFLEAAIASGADMIVADDAPGLFALWRRVPLRRPSGPGRCLPG